jgi:site-specific recombinase XerD
MSSKKSKVSTLPSNHQVKDTKTDTKEIIGKQPTQFKLSAESKALIDEYKTYLGDDHKAKATIRSYLFDVNSFVEYIENVEKRSFAGQFNNQEYRNYLNYDESKGSKPATLNKRINSIQSFNQWLIDKKSMTALVANQKTDKYPTKVQSQ